MWRIGTFCIDAPLVCPPTADMFRRWGPLLGPDKAFDPTRFFIFCANVIGSPYGTVSSVTTNPETGKPYGPEMPGSSPKDDVRCVPTL